MMCKEYIRQLNNGGLWEGTRVFKINGYPDMIDKRSVKRMLEKREAEIQSIVRNENEKLKKEQSISMLIERIKELKKDPEFIREVNEIIKESM